MDSNHRPHAYQLSLKHCSHLVSSTYPSHIPAYPRKILHFLHPIRTLSGESLAYVKDQLGHSSISMTVDVYGHLVPGANRAAMDRLPTEETAGGDPVESAERSR